MTYHEMLAPPEGCSPGGQAMLWGLSADVQVLDLQMVIFKIMDREELDSAINRRKLREYIRKTMLLFLEGLLVLVR